MATSVRKSRVNWVADARRSLRAGNGTRLEDLD